MGILFRNIYSWFQELYGSYLYDYLKGWDCASSTISNSNQFLTIGIITLLITLTIVLIYYYGIRHPRFAKWWVWIIFLFSAGAINLIYGFSVTNTKLQSGQIDNCLLYNTVYDAQGNVAQQAQLIFSSNCWGFGIANMIVSILMFIIISFCVKWWSRDAKYSPF